MEKSPEVPIWPVCSICPQCDDAMGAEQFPLLLSFSRCPLQRILRFLNFTVIGGTTSVHGYLSMKLEHEKGRKRSLDLN